MPQTTLESQQEIPTCATCPFYQSRHDGTDKGWCGLFNVFARESHAQTQDCINEIAVQEIDEQPIVQVQEAPKQQPAVVSGSLIFKPSLSANPAKTVYEVFCGDSLGIIIKDEHGWHNSKTTDRYASPYEAAADLLGPLPTVETVVPDIEVDSDLDPDFGVMYRVWRRYHLLGTFYRALGDGKWVAQPVGSNFRPRLNTPEQAQLVIIAASGCLTAGLLAA